MPGYWAASWGVSMLYIVPADSALGEGTLEEKQVWNIAH